MTQSTHDEQLREGLRIMIRSASINNKLPKWVEWFFILTILTGTGSAMALGSSQYPKIAPIPVRISDHWTHVLWWLLIGTAIVIFGAIWINHRLTKPIREVMRQFPELQTATSITLETRSDRTSTLILTPFKELRCGTRLLNPIDAPLVCMAYKMVGKKPPTITESLG